MAIGNPRQTVNIAGDYIEVDSRTDWRGKTGGYFRAQVSIVRIVDKDGHDVPLVREPDWRESAPGIETRCRGDGARAGKCETHRDESVRIHREACPVSIQFEATDEYVDYEDSQYSSLNRSVYWIRYER